MGLDVYAGPLSRYYAGDWLTVVQQLGREQGIAVEVRRPAQADEGITDPEQVLERILEWRAGLQRALVDLYQTPSFHICSAGRNCGSR